MDVDRSTPVADVAASLPGALRVLDELRIDYCCAGRRSLGDACRLHGLDTDTVLARIGEVAARESPGESAWTGRSLRSIIDHIVSTHHAFTRAELDRLRDLVADAQDAEGSRSAALLPIAVLLADLGNEIVPHMVMEERILFPYIIELEIRARAGNRRPLPPFGPDKNPIRTTMREHDHCDGTLRALRRACSDYVVPAGSSPELRALYTGLEALERDLHHHVHIESNVLFRRALDLEQS